MNGLAIFGSIPEPQSEEQEMMNVELLTLASHRASGTAATVFAGASNNLQNNSRLPLTILPDTDPAVPT